MTCPVCGESNGACNGSATVRLTADQLRDIGLKPEDLAPGGTITMGDQVEPQARYPKVDPDSLPKGAEHGYIGAVDVYDPNSPGHSNVEVGRPNKGETVPIVGATGAIASDDLSGTVDNVSSRKR